MCADKLFLLAKGFDSNEESELLDDKTKQRVYLCTTADSGNERHVVSSGKII